MNDLGLYVLCALTSPYAALAPEPGDPNDNQTSLVYDTRTGELSVNAPVDKELGSINIDSEDRKFIGDKPDVLIGNLDTFDAGNIFKAHVGRGIGFGSIEFGQVLPAGLSPEELVADLTAVGALMPRPGGGPLGPVDLIFLPPIGALQAGDANQNLSFDQLDLVQVAQAGKYLTGEPATWGEGDWDGAPGGEPGNPPPGDELFDQLDIIAALASGVYLTGPYPLQSGGGLGEVDLHYIPVPERSAVVLLGLG